MNAPTRHISLGIPGLSALIGELVNNGLYSIKFDDTSERMHLIAQSLVVNLSRGIPCRLITPLHGADFLSRCNSRFQDMLTTATRQKTLSILSMTGDYGKNIFRYGPGRFLSELKNFVRIEGSFLICDQADDLFTISDQAIAVEQGKFYRQWMQENDCTALYLFLRSASDHAIETNYQAVSDYFTGAANFGGNKEGSRLSINFWRSTDGTVAAKNIPLILDENEYLHASSGGDHPNALGNIDWQPPPDARDQMDVYFMDDELAAALPQNGGRRVLSANLDSILQDTKSSAMATIILSYSRESDLRQLARTVHTLRLRLGKYIRIVVREKGVFLRYYNELLMLRLGANLVMHENVAPSRIPLLLESLNGQVFRQEMDLDFEQAIASILPSRKKGYLAPVEFCEEVESVMQQAQALNVPCVLSRIPHTDPKRILDSIRRFKLTRAGDLLSADNTYCYLFLHACPEVNFRGALQRLMGGHALPDGYIVEFHATRDAIANKISPFKHASQQGNTTDFSNLIEVEHHDAYRAPPPASAPAHTPVQETLPATIPPVVATTVQSPVLPSMQPAAAEVQRFAWRTETSAQPVVATRRADAFLHALKHRESTPPPAETLIPPSPIAATTSVATQTEAAMEPHATSAPYLRSPAPRAHRKIH